MAGIIFMYMILIGIGAMVVVAVVAVLAFSTKIFIEVFMKWIMN